MQLGKEGDWRCRNLLGRANSVPFEVLYRALVPLCRGASGKRAEIAALAGLRIRPAGIKAVLAGGKLADHRRLPLTIL